MKKELIIILSGVLLFVCVIWLAISLHNANVNLENVNSFNKEIINDIKKDLANRELQAQDEIKNANHKIDSLQVLFNYSEDLRKKNFKYYENESLKLKAVNTFVKRNKYLDSLNLYLKNN